MQHPDQGLTREDYEKLLLYLGYARLVLSRPGMNLAPEESKARVMLAELHAELERREQGLAPSCAASGRSWGPWN
jgi:hypothetical protein